MKKILIIIVLFLNQLSFGQYFSLTQNGFISKENKDYVVIDFPGEKQIDIYKKVLNAVNTIYSDPKEVLSVVDGQSITIKGYEEKKLDVKEKLNYLQIGKSTIKYDISYSLSILFKDDKIRINSPSFECRKWYDNVGWIYLRLMKDNDTKRGIYNKSGKLVAEGADKGLNDYFNSLINQIVDKSKNINEW